MSRTLSTAATTAMMQQETAKVFLTLLEIDHADMAAPLRFVDDYSAVTSGGNEYSSLHFKCDLPCDKEDELPAVTLTVDNVDRSLVPTISAYAKGLTVAVSVILADSPDTIEYGPVEMTVQDIGFNAETVILTLGFDDFLNEGFPCGSFDPQHFPGLFSDVVMSA